MGERIKVSQLNEHIYLLDDAGMSTAYLVVGDKKALLIDTMIGFENPREAIAQITDLPLMVVNTHGHPDHIYGNVYFEEVYINPAEWDVFTEFLTEPKFLEMANVAGLKMPPFKDICPGEVIDLGGLHLEVYGIMGHTPGGILLLLREDRVLFTGDAINHHLWMQLQHSTSFAIFKESLEKLLFLEKEADFICHGHAQGFDDISLLRHMYEGVEEILAGEVSEDAEYQWFGGTGRTHKIPGDEGVICYNPVEPRVYRDRKNWAASDAARDAGLEEPSDVTAYKNIPYSVYGEDSLLDVYVPENKSLANANGKLPVVVNVHGGGYFYGDKDLYRFYSMAMAQYGFVVVNMNYRKSPEYTFPCILQDINAVFCWMEAHGAAYGMDLERINMMGDSAGAQLTSHYAAINSNPEFASLYPLKPHSLKVKRIAVACGMYSLVDRLELSDNTDIMKDYLKGLMQPDNPKLDVLGAITADYPETFAFTCPNDFLYDKSEPFVKLINEKGGKAKVKYYGSAERKEVGHVFHCNLRLDVGEEARRDQAEFFARG